MVMLSLVVAVLAFYTALPLVAWMTASRVGFAAAWLSGGAIAMGIGIWSMHFIGMLAFRLPIPVGYDLALTVYSMLVAILTSALALWLTSRADLSVPRLGLGALLMGLVIALMHYMGMGALCMVKAISYDPLLFGLDRHRHRHRRLCRCVMDRLPAAPRRASLQSAHDRRRDHGRGDRGHALHRHGRRAVRTRQFVWSRGRYAAAIVVAGGSGAGDPGLADTGAGHFGAVAPFSAAYRRADAIAGQGQC